MKRHPMQSTNHNLHRIWLGALGCFVLAGVTGAAFRFGVLYGLPAGLTLGNVRHAHSHLMYFGWATPALMALTAAWLPAVTGRPLRAGLRRVAGITVALALLAYPPFLAYGYGLADIAGRRLPLAMMAASLNILAWYAFIVLYVRATWGVPRSRPLRLWDAALAFQTLASMGAWGRAVLAVLDISDPFWTSATVYLFLGLFSDGWFVLALLGLAYAAYPLPAHAAELWGVRLMVLGLPVTFLLDIPVAEVPPDLRVVAGVGGVLVALGLLGNVWALWPRVAERRGRAWRVPLVFLAVKALAELGLSLPSVALWAERTELRIFYLHILLLGFVTLGLLAAAQDVWGSEFVRARRWMTVAVLLLLATLIPLTRLWPAAWAGRGALLAAAWASLGPPVVGIAMGMAAGERARELQHRLSLKRDA